MGLLGKYAAYRWLSSGDGGGSGALVVFLAVFAGIMLAIWAVFEAFSYAWNLTYGFVRPFFMVYPPVTVPAGVVLGGWVLTRIGPYSAEKANAIVNGTDETYSFAVSGVVAVVAVNAVFLIGHYEAFPEPSGGTGVVLGLLLVAIMLYGLYELVHLPYRCIRLVVRAPRGTSYAIAFLSPMVFVILTGAFDLPVDLPFATPDLPDSERVVTVGALTIINGTYLGGVLAVLWNRDTICTRESTAESDVRSERHSGELSVNTEVSCSSK
ncbi:hypothetical protein [Halovivax gelatinilyticus]|uniref:hypothetical protein n=1 Tax=Halovivax gelatinilyticus TaxID=2961597 RepID=UPI0020CA8E2A|nr:hypothetical protein [Halovivax gelatinilyticus]